MGPSRSKGKGRAPTQEMDQGEVTGIVCDLCAKKGVPCRTGKVSSFNPFFFCLISLMKMITEDSPCPSMPGLSAGPGKMPGRRSRTQSVEADEGGGPRGGP